MDGGCRLHGRNPRFEKARGRNLDTKKDESSLEVAARKFAFVLFESNANLFDR